VSLLHQRNLRGPSRGMRILSQDLGRDLGRESAIRLDGRTDRSRWLACRAAPKKDPHAHPGRNHHPIPRAPGRACFMKLERPYSWGENTAISCDETLASGYFTTSGKTYVLYLRRRLHPLNLGVEVMGRSESRICDSTADRQSDYSHPRSERLGKDDRA